MTGEWPKEYIAHSDDNTGNNRWDNLEEMSVKEHQQRHAARLKEIWNAKPPIDPLKPKRQVKASFSNKEVHEAVEDFIKNKILVNGRYV